jgi:septum formation protein
MAENGAARLVLASASPYRRRMLESAGLSFEVAAAEIDEAALKRRLTAAAHRPGPETIAEALAQAKAEAVSRIDPGALIIGADQVLAFGDELFDKPGDLVAARAQLERLRGKTHRLHTAAALARGGRIVWTRVEIATLTMRLFSPEFLDRYLAESGAGLAQIVGAYQIEGTGIQLFERVEGDQFTIIGLPLIPLLAELRARGAIAT